MCRDGNGGGSLVAVTQMTSTGDKEKNFETCARLVSEAASVGAKVCVFVSLSYSQIMSMYVLFSQKLQH